MSLFAEIVDTDQAGVIANYAGDEDNSRTLTSAMKGLYPTTYDTLKDVILNGNWANYGGKVATLGLVNAEDPSANYVQIPMENTQWNDEFTKDDYAAMVKAMMDGTLTVSNDAGENLPEVTNVKIDNQGKIK